MEAVRKTKTQFDLHGWALIKQRSVLVELARYLDSLPPSTGKHEDESPRAGLHGVLHDALKVYFWLVGQETGDEIAAQHMFNTDLVTELRMEGTLGLRRIMLEVEGYPESSLPSALRLDDLYQTLRREEN